MDNDIIEQELYNIENLLLAISDFRRMDIKTQTYESIFEKFKSFINIFFLDTCNIGGLTIYRVRKINDGDSHQFKNDVWCPCPDKVKFMGRLNNIKESVFYAAFDPITAIKEAKIKSGEKFSLAIFNLIAKGDNDLSTIKVGISEPYKNLKGNKRLFMMILNDFMYSEFTRPVGKGTEYQYKASCSIGKLLFELPRKDSLLYPSMIDSSKKNIAIKYNSAEERAKLLQVLKCELIEYDLDFNPIISIFQEATVDNDELKLNYKKFNHNARNIKLNEESFYEVNPLNKLDFNK